MPGGAEESGQIEACVQSAIQRRLDRAAEQGATLDWTVYAGWVPLLRSEILRLEHMVVAMLDNSLGQTTGGTITIRVAPVRETARDVLVHCAISDPQGTRGQDEGPSEQPFMQTLVAGEPVGVLYHPEQGRTVWWLARLGRAS